MAHTVFPVAFGRTLQMRFTVFNRGESVDDLAERIDLTGYVLRFALKTDAADDESSFLIKKNDSADPLDVVLLPQGAGLATRGQYDVFLRTADFGTPAVPLIPLGENRFDTVVISPAGDPHDVETGVVLVTRAIDDLV